MSLLIGLSKASGSPRYANYISWLTSSDVPIEVVDLSASTDFEADLARLDGLVLTGGSDVDPVLYEQPGDRVKCEDVDAKRDASELRMLELAEARELPVLGICRGLQVQNVFKGGSLISHVPDEVEGGERHQKSGDDDSRHTVELMPGTLLLRTTGQLAGEVNSAHHQAVDRLGSGLIVSALAPDGVIEGIEIADPGGSQWFVGVQWHPERMADRESNPMARDLLAAFLFEVESARILSRTSARIPKEELPPTQQGGGSQLPGDSILPIIQ